MYTFSCCFLLHHHFEALTTSTDSRVISSTSINDDIMSDESDYQDDSVNLDQPEQIPPDEIIDPEPYHERTKSTINSVDEEDQFIFDEETRRLLCIGMIFSDIPRSIIDAYAEKTKILDISKNRFRSLDFLKDFPNLEELILDENDLDDAHSIFPKLPNLHTLMINKNRLQDIYKLVDQLRNAYPSLTHLSLLGNEACPYRIIPTTTATLSTNTDLSAYAQKRVEEDYQRYRHLMIFRLPTLKFLDASEISDKERNIASQLGDILYSIAETKQSQSGNEEKKSDKRDSYTPLPTNTNHTNHRATIGRLRHNYHGEGSQGNKFVQDTDL